MTRTCDHCGAEYWPRVPNPLKCPRCQHPTPEEMARRAAAKIKSQEARDDG